MRKMKYLTLAVIALPIVSAYSQTNNRQEIAAIKYAKTYQVSRIEKGLAAKPFGVWVRELVGAKTPVTWEVNDCGEQTGTSADRGRDFPMCVQATAKQSESFFISVNIQYGTFKRGITQMRPVVRYISTGEESGDYVDSLADLRRTLQQRKVDAEFFDPSDGIFYLSDKIVPKGFEGLDDMYLQTKDYNRRNTLVPIKPTGGIVFGQTKFPMRNIVFDGKRLSFETVVIDSVSYKFDGYFSKITLDAHGAQDGDKVLHGRLTKFVGGEQIAAADLTFSFVIQGE